MSTGWFILQPSSIDDIDLTVGDEMDRNQGRIHGYPSSMRMGRADRDRQTKKDGQMEKIVPLHSTVEPRSNEFQGTSNFILLYTDFCYCQ